MRDWVKCCNCEWQGTIEIGKEICPNCNKEGCLAWVDENKQEVENEM